GRVTWPGFWSGGWLAVPLGLGVCAAGGSFVAAEYYFGRGGWSLYALLGALLLYGLMALWVQLRRAEVARRQADAAAPIAAAPQRLDLAAIGEQTRSLPDVLVTLVVLGGLWWGWKDAGPAPSG